MHHPIKISIIGRHDQLKSTRPGSTSIEQDRVRHDVRVVQRLVREGGRERGYAVIAVEDRADGGEGLGAGGGHSGRAEG